MHNGWIHITTPNTPISRKPYYGCMNTIGSESVTFFQSKENATNMNTNILLLLLLLCFPADLYIPSKNYLLFSHSFPSLPLCCCHFPSYSKPCGTSDRQSWRFYLCVLFSSSHCQVRYFSACVCLCLCVCVITLL